MRRRWIAVLQVVVIAALAASAATGQSQTTQSDQEIPKAKQTTSGLYVTAKQAYEMWQVAPEQVKILDVRTPEEFLFVGHAEMAWNIPFAVQTYQWNPDKQHLAMKPDPAFVYRAKGLFAPGDTLLVMCRSGGRSAMSVNLLTEAGFTNVYNIIDGMEGDLVEDPENAHHGKRMKNGWKNSGLPWTYDLTPERMRLPDRPSKTE